MTLALPDLSDWQAWRDSLPDVATWRGSYEGAGSAKALMRAALIIVQGGQCALCLRELSSLHCDHDHVTGLVRGMLCQSCNNREGNRWADWPVLGAYRANPPAGGAGWLWDLSGITAAAWAKVGHGDAASVPVIVPPELLHLAPVVAALVRSAEERLAQRAGAVLQTVKLPVVDPARTSSQGLAGSGIPVPAEASTKTEVPALADTGHLPWWSVTLEYRGGDASLVTDEPLSELVTALVAHSGIVTGGGGQPAWGATVSVQAATAVEAVIEAALIVTRHSADAALPSWPVVRAQAVRQDVLDEDLARPAS